MTDTAVPMPSPMCVKCFVQFTYGDKVVPVEMWEYVTTSKTLTEYIHLRCLLEET